MARRVVIGKLAAVLSLGNKQFNSGLRESQGKLRTFSRGVKIMGLGVASAGAALAVGAAGLLKWGANQARTLNDTVQFSRRLGVATDKLMGLHAAGKVWGVTASNINLGLQRMTRRIAEAGQGTGEAKNALKELGLPAKALAQLDPGAQFMQVADAMANVANRGDQVRLAFKLFDSEGVGLINLLDKGRAKLDDIMGFAKQVGATLHEGGANQVTKTAEALAKAALAWDGIKLQLSSALLEPVGELATAFTEWMGEQANIEALQAGIQGIAKGVSWLVKQAGGVMGVVSDANKGFVGGETFSPGVANFVGSFMPSVERTRQESSDIEARTQVLKDAERRRRAGIDVSDQEIRDALQAIANHTANSAVPAT
jgi:hypothetical protein